MFLCYVEIFLFYHLESIFISNGHSNANTFRDNLHERIAFYFNLDDTFCCVFGKNDIMNK